MTDEEKKCRCIYMSDELWEDIGNECDILAEEHDMYVSRSRFINDVVIESIAIRKAERNKHGAYRLDAMNEALTGGYEQEDYV